MTSREIRAATRGSQLALDQANGVKGQLTHTCPDLEVDLTVIKTRGDKIHFLSRRAREILDEVHGRSDPTISLDNRKHD